MRIVRTAAAGSLATALLVCLAPASAPAQPVAGSTTTFSGVTSGAGRTDTSRLTPRTHFTMKADGSSGKTVGGEGIPNVDSVKRTIATYYGDPGTGIAGKVSSPYIAELDQIMARQSQTLQARYDRALRRHQGTPTLVFDTDDTTLFTYDMEVAAMHFDFDPALQDVYVQGQRFPATPAMVAYVKKAKKIGYTIVGLTGRNDDQKSATLANLSKVGYGTAFTRANFYTKWTGKGSSQQPSYLRCVAACTTVEYKAGTRRYLEQQRHLDVVATYGDQWSDLMGGYADHTVKLPNPTYYLPSTNLPGKRQPELAPRTRFTMAPDGSSGAYVSGEAIPNVDAVKKTINVYYGDPGTGIADKVSSPYVTELTKIAAQQRRTLRSRYQAAIRRGEKPALVFDTDDTTLFTYDMEVAGMHFDFDPALQDVYVQGQKFAATPAMVGYVNYARSLGFTIFGLTGRNVDQQPATIANLSKVGYDRRAFVSSRFFTKWTGVGASQQPSYLTCANAKCTTIEYKSQTRRHIEHDLGYTILANFGDQYSDLQGRYADRTVKLPNPTYYLP